MTGDQTLFVHADEVEGAWRLYDPILSRKPDEELRAIVDEELKKLEARNS